MSNILSTLLAERRQETKLNTGRIVGWHYPDVQECILKVGQIPMSALSLPDEEPTEEEAARLIAEQPEAIAKSLEFTRLMVAAMLDDIDGVTLDPEDDRLAIVDALDGSERQELFLLSSRQKDPDSGEA
jgi:hypothetical protein